VNTLFAIYWASCKTPSVWAREWQQIELS